MSQILSLTVQRKTELPSEIANVTIMQTYQPYTTVLKSTVNEKYRYKW